MHDELTKIDIQKMQEELDYRLTVVTREVTEDVQQARAQGDLSENFEYKAAKQAMNKNKSRIRYLQNMIKTAEIVEDTSKDDEVGLYNTVTVYFEEDEEEETFKIVTTVRRDVFSNKITKESPIGAAIFGKKVGDRCLVTLENGTSYYVVIRKIENTHDDGSDELRSY